MGESKLSQLSQNRRADSLLGCLEFLSQYFNRPSSKESLRAGFTIHNTAMTLDGFIDSAKRIGLISKVVNRKLKGLTPLAFPSVLLLKSNRACVIVDINHEKNYATIIMPGLSEGQTRMPLDRLESEYIERAVIIKPVYNFSNRISDGIEIVEPKQWFFGALKRNASIYSKVVIAAIIINLLVLATPLFMKNVFDRVLPNNAIESLWAMAIGILIIMIFDFVLKLLRAHYIGKAGKRADVVMSNKIFDQVLNIKLNDKPMSTGQFVSRLQAFESVRDFFTSATVATLVDIPFIILFIAVIFYFGGVLGFVPLGAIVISLIFTLIIERRSKVLSQKASKEEQLKQSTLNETVSGLEVIKSVNAYNRMRIYWDRALTQTTYFNEKLQFISQLNSFFTGFIAQLSTIAIIILGVYLALEGEMTMGGIIAAMMLSNRVLSPMSQIVGMIMRYEKTMIALDGIEEIMDMDTEKRGLNLLSRPNLNGDIEFREVKFSYRGQNVDVLKKIDLKIKQGEKVAILGKIGSGKSTITKLLMNLYSPTGGSVLIDRTDVRQIDPADLRKAVGCVPQEPFLFMGTVKDNITIGEQFVSDEEILEVGRLTGVQDFIEKHESGYDLMVGERGEGLSGGEKQSVTLARALVSDPNILILDEPTNSMDKQHERKFIERLEEVVEDKTLIVVTHKYALLKLVDRVIVVNNGEIVADGPKDEVLKRKVAP